ncbi:MAG TPA: hypothetical protein VFX92_11910 [Candidatus Krumholzibacteria bacterium]|nr:hypothetical protein [Candidatus Krumholzibacteria bacterium]
MMKLPRLDRRGTLLTILLSASVSCTVDDPPSSPIAPPNTETARDAQWSVMTTSREMTAICELGNDVLVLSNGGAALRGALGNWTGDLTRFQPIADVWASPDGQAFAVGGATVSHFDGERWTWREYPFDRLYGVWGASPTDVYAVGEGVNEEEWYYVWPLGVYHYNGTAWKRMNVITDYGSPTLRAVWGSGASNVIAVGDGGHIFRYDGASWLEMASPTTTNLLSVWGRGPDDVYSVGSNGVIVHYDGSDWVPMPNPSTQRLVDVHGSPMGDVVAVGDAGTIVRLAAGHWQVMMSGTPSRLNAILVRSDTDMYALGQTGAIHHYDGNVWSRVWGGLAAGVLWGVWASSPEDIFAVGEGGRIVHYDGSAWRGMTSGTGAALLDVWGSGPDDVFAVGSGGVVVHYDGSAWTRMQSSTTEGLSRIFGFVGGPVFAMSWSGGLFLYDGMAWKQQASAGSAISGLWGDAPGSLFAVGPQGFAARFDGTDWTRMETGTLADLQTVWGYSSSDVTAFGVEVLHYNGSEWKKLVYPGWDFDSAWGDPFGHIFASHTAGVHQLYAGQVTQVRHIGFLNDMWGVSTDMFGVSMDGLVLRYGKLAAPLGAH